MVTFLQVHLNFAFWPLAGCAFSSWWPTVNIFEPPDAPILGNPYCKTKYIIVAFKSLTLLSGWVRCVLQTALPCLSW